MVRARGGNRTKGLYGSGANIPTERDPIRGAIISVAWRYSWAIFTRRARRAGVSALRASLSSTQRIFRIVSPKAYSWYANNTDAIGSADSCVNPLFRRGQPDRELSDFVAALCELGPSTGIAALRGLSKRPIGLRAAARREGRKAAIQHPWRPALVSANGQRRADSCTCRLDAPGTANRTAHY